MPVIKLFSIRLNIAISLLSIGFLSSCSTGQPNDKAAKDAALPKTAISVTEKACDKMELTVSSGKNMFVITNAGSNKVEWEIIEGVKVVEEVENLAPGFVHKLKANLKPGEYGMICGRKSNTRGKITVKA
jgi:iron uptake system component EfeO